MNSINAKDCTIGICYKGANLKSRVIFLALSVIALSALIYMQVFTLKYSILDYKIIVYMTMGLPVISIFSFIFCKPDVPIHQQSKDKDMAYGNGINRHNDRNEMYYRNYQNNLRTIERSQAGLNNMLQSRSVRNDEESIRNDAEDRDVEILSYEQREEYLHAHWHELYKDNFVLTKHHSAERKTELIAKIEIIRNKRIAFVEKNWEHYAIQLGYTDIDVNTTGGLIKMARTKMRLWNLKELRDIKESDDPDLREITYACSCNDSRKMDGRPDKHKTFYAQVKCVHNEAVELFEMYKPSECTIL